MKLLKVKLLENMRIEDFHWLNRDLIAGEEFFVFNGMTYGCISSTGIAVSEESSTNPYFEIPKKFVQFI